MTGFIIAKDAMHGAMFVVTAIQQGGLRIDNVRVEQGRETLTLWRARTWKTRVAADKAQKLLAERGGYDDYTVRAL